MTRSRQRVTPAPGDREAGRGGPLLKRNLLPAAGVRPKVVQERLGYSQVSVTLDAYRQVAPSLQREAAG